MKRYFLFLSYDGAGYHGWQRQPNGVSVEETVEHALSLLLRREVDIVGAGRTDTGVNAKCMPAHFDITDEDERIVKPALRGTFEEGLEYKLNKILPRDIAVDKVVRVNGVAHARFDACERTYHYYVTTKKNVFTFPHCFTVPPGIDFNCMNEAARLLVRRDDFASFAKTHTDVKTTVCDVRRAVWENVGDSTWRFEITADRFLRNMVRAVVGTLIDVGRGRLCVTDVEKVLAHHDRCAAGESVPGGALFLHSVKYPERVFKYEHKD